MEATINNLVNRECLSHSRMIFEIEATCCELGLERNKKKQKTFSSTHKIQVLICLFDENDVKHKPIPLLHLRGH